MYDKYVSKASINTVTAEKQNWPESNVVNVDFYSHVNTFTREK